VKKHLICYLSALLFLFTSLIFGQVESYGNNNEDTVTIVQKAPEWKNKPGTLEIFIANHLRQNIKLHSHQLAVPGINARLKFTISKDGKPKNISVDCQDQLLLIGLEDALYEMPDWRPSTKNNIAVEAKMEYYMLITKIEAGEYVLTQERAPPKLDKSMKMVKIIIIVASVAVLLFAWRIF